MQYLKSGKTASPTSLQNITYTYDAVGNITQILNSKASETSNYGYDALNRLASWSLGGTNETYTYEASTGNLDVKAGVNLNYNDANHVHAVTHIGSTQKYWYDADGNQTKRIVGGQTFNLSYDAENRLVSVSGAVSASFVYDGDGKQVKATVAGTTTYYVGSIYEITGTGAVTKYYFAGAQRVAMRAGSTLTYLLGDHLGSTALSVNTNGALVAELRYKPWGETRYTSGTMATDYQFTSQRNEASLGLYFYQSRWYDSYLNHFAQPDSIVPDPYSPQAWDRYVYTLNNPVRYTDPTGHKECVDSDNHGNCLNGTQVLIRDLEAKYAIKLKGGWDENELIYLSDALDKAANLAGGAKNLNDIFLDAMRANGHSTDRLTFDNRAGNTSPKECNGGFACWAWWKDTIVLSDYIFTKAYQDANFQPKELGLFHNLNALVQVTMIHEMIHVFADARPAAAKIYSWRVPNKPGEDNAEERMANTIAFYLVSGMQDWPGKPNHFDFVRDISQLWQATP